MAPGLPSVYPFLQVVGAMSVHQAATPARDFVDSIALPAVRGNPAEVQVCCDAVVAAQKSLWRLRWDNAFKEVYWRLVCDGLPTAERMRQQDCGCVCVVLL